MNLVKLILIVVIVIFFSYFSQFGVNAQVCGGNIVCNSSIETCLPDGCTKGFNCTSCTTDNSPQSYPCSGFNQLQCTDNTFAQTFCNTEFTGGSGGGLKSNGCFWDPGGGGTVPTATPVPICGGGSYSNCGGVIYCGTSCACTGTVCCDPSTPYYYNGFCNSVPQPSCSGICVGSSFSSGVQSCTTSTGLPGHYNLTSGNSFSNCGSGTGPTPYCAVCQADTLPTCSGICVNSSYSSGSQTCTVGGKAGSYIWQPGNYSPCAGTANSQCAVCQASATAPTSIPTPTTASGGGGGACSSPNTCATSSTISAACTSYGNTWQTSSGTCSSEQSCGQCVTTAAPPPSGGGSCSCDINYVCMTDAFGNPTCVYVAPGCSVGTTSHYMCQSNACVLSPTCGTDSCSSNQDCTCGDGICEAYESASTCSGDCVKSVTGTVYLDSNGDGTFDNRSVTCDDVNDNGSCDSGERTYTSSSSCSFSGASNCLTIPAEEGIANLGAHIFGSNGSSTITKSSNGTYSLPNFNSGSTYTINMSPIPAGYTLSPGASNTNPRSVTIGTSGTGSRADFGLSNPPSCGPIVANPATIAPNQTSDLSVTCASAPPATSFTWTPTTNIGGQIDTPTTSHVTFTPPACTVSGPSKTYNMQVKVAGSEGNATYAGSVTVPTTYTMTVNIQKVTSTVSCPASGGTAYTDSSIGVNFNGINQPTTTGTTSFACVPGGTSYNLSVSPPSGYSVVGVNNNGVQSIPGSNTISGSMPNLSPTVTFCIAPINPWFQTDIGDVRFNNLKNPVPKGQTASTSTTYPGIFYSSDVDASFGDGNVSTKNWVVNNENSYNTKTQNRNGSMSYDFYKSKALKEGISPTPIPDDGVVDVNSLKSGVYEATGTTGNIIINSDTTISGRHIVLLTKGTVTINNNITVPINSNITVPSENGGLFILASKGDMIVDPAVTNLDGYYSSQKDITIESTDSTCKDNKDQQLVVNGVLIANALKPFANEPTGTINLQRTLCINNQSQPALKLNFRPDFLIQLTDFYKTTYTKWSEVNP